MQHLIDAWRKRLCFKATKEARELAEDFKLTLAETHPMESDILVPNCIYRFGCPEFQTCGYFAGFCKWVIAHHPDEDLMDIDVRYTLYNEYFKEKHNG